MLLIPNRSEFSWEPCDCAFTRSLISRREHRLKLECCLSQIEASSLEKPMRYTTTQTDFSLFMSLISFYSFVCRTNVRNSNAEIRVYTEHKYLSINGYSPCMKYKHYCTHLHSLYLVKWTNHYFIY